LSASRIIPHPRRVCQGHHPSARRFWDLKVSLPPQSPLL
jgi:hypothetical protein